MIADFLRQRLQELGMSQADLARQLTLRGKDYTRAAVQQWLNGTNFPPLLDEEFRVALASSLEMSTSQLAEALGFMVNEGNRSDQATRAAEIVDRLPDEWKTIALEYLDMLDRHHVKLG